MTKHTTRMALLLSIVSLSCHGCSLEPLSSYGEACPPGDGARGQLSYVQMGVEARCGEGDGCYGDEFLYDVCPEEFVKCNIDTAGAYYCMQRCPTGQIACDGQCIEPMKNDAYCGAKDTCSDSGASCCRDYSVCGSWQTCVDGACQDKSCMAGETRCEAGVVYVCRSQGGKVQWAQLQVCAAEKCNEEKTGCPSATPCEIDGVHVLHDSRKCSADGRKIYGCQNGVPYEDETCPAPMICADRAGVPVCGDHESCTLDGRIVSHGQSVCDGSRVLKCTGGALTETLNCALSDDGKTACREGSCAVPNCFVSGAELADGSALCEGNVLRTCRAGALDEGADCGLNPDGKTVCRDGACAAPRRCTVDFGDVTKIMDHNAALCRDDVLITCNDSVALNQSCTKTGGACATTDGGARCVPAFSSIKSIRMVFDQLYDESECSTLDELRVDARVDVTGIVTAMRMTQNNYGFVMQALGDNPRNGGIIVNCKSQECQKYGDGSRVAIGDVVRVQSSQLNSYWCQLQIDQDSGSPAVSKLEMSATLAPVEIGAQDLSEPGKYEPNNPYNAVLVSIKNVSIDSAQDKMPSGYNGIDGNGKDIFVNNLIFLDESEAVSKKMPVGVGRTYDIVGVGVWSFNKSTIAPRFAADIAEVNPCETVTENAAVCLRRKGSDLSAYCVDGAILPDRQENCTAGAKICDLSATQPYDGTADISLCRDPVSCADVNGNAIVEGEWGCENNSTLARCVADAGCVADEHTTCPRGIWSTAGQDRKTCSQACNAAKRQCEAAVINKCEFTEIDSENALGRVRVEDISDAEVESYIYCTTDTSLPIALWPTKIRLMAVPPKACATCPPGVTEYASLANALPDKDGVYSCVAVASIVSGDDYVCSKTLMAPTRLGEEMTAEVSWIINYETGDVPRILASWNFDSDDCLNLTGGVKTESSFGLSSDASAVKCMYGEYASAQVAWSTADTADFGKDLYWSVGLDTKGYREIALSFEILSSKENNLVTVAYKIGDSADFVAAGDPAEIPLRGSLYVAPIEVSLPADASNAEKLVIGIFPHKTVLNKNNVGPNIRVDNVVVRGIAAE